MLFIRHSISNPSGRLIGQCGWVVITARLVNLRENFFFGNGLARTRNTTNDFDSSAILPISFFVKTAARWSFLTKLIKPGALKGVIEQAGLTLEEFVAEL